LAATLEWSPAADIYDLVVVGGGASGLSAAYFYRKEHPDARILILDNHDDFGGHVKRKELRAAGRHYCEIKNFWLEWFGKSWEQR
jgi:protoporphyrinogen oxidase